MSLEGFFDQDLLSRFSYQNEYAPLNMILIENPPKMPTKQRLSETSTVGLFDKLPNEILHLALHKMVLRSLSRLSQVSTRGSTVVQSLSAYCDLLQYAPHAMTALGRTGSIRYHTLQALHVTLYLQKCASCGFFGAFLFILTCERCCYGCLSRNQSFWVTSPAVARKCFDLRPCQIKGLPVLRSLPGTYHVGNRGSVTHNRRRNLVSVRSARSLGIRVHGSTMNMPDWQALCDSGDRSTKDWRENQYLRWLQKAPMYLQEGDPLKRPKEDHMTKDLYCGMASIPFPAFINGEVDSGLWCRGCASLPAIIDLSSQQEIELALGVSLDDSLDMVDMFGQLQYRARSTRGLLAHVKHCYGVTKLQESER